MFFVVGSYDLERCMLTILDSPGVFVGFLVCSVDLSCQSKRSTVMYTASPSSVVKQLDLCPPPPQN